MPRLISKGYEKWSVIILLLSIFMIVMGCSKPNYSYKLTHYSIINGDTEELPFRNHLISYNGYLFEFALSLRWSDSVYLKSKKLPVEHGLMVRFIFSIQKAGATLSLIRFQ
jgi:hypothetical protein